MNIAEFDTLASFLSGLSQEKLAKRLNVSVLMLQKMSKTSDFGRWSQEQDPDGVSWKFCAKTRYLPHLAFSEEV